MSDIVQEYLDNTPGGLIVLLDLIFQEEYGSAEPSMCSFVKMQSELDRVKALLDESNKVS